MNINVTEERSELQEATCQHHWLIATPEGAMSTGRCKRCGETRDFPNSAGESFWEREGEHGGSPWNRSIRARSSMSGDGGF